nr:hypothetical protein [Nakamurella deserti]
MDGLPQPHALGVVGMLSAVVQHPAAEVLGEDGEHVGVGLDRRGAGAVHVQGGRRHPLRENRLGDERPDAGGFGRDGQPRPPAADLFQRHPDPAAGGHRLQARATALPVLLLVDDQDPVRGVGGREGGAVELRRHARPVGVRKQPHRLRGSAVHEMQQAPLIGDPRAQHLDEPGHLVRMRGQRAQDLRRHPGRVRVTGVAVPPLGGGR